MLFSFNNFWKIWLIFLIIWGVYGIFGYEFTMVTGIASILAKLNTMTLTADDE